MLQLWRLTLFPLQKALFFISEEWYLTPKSWVPYWWALLLLNLFSRQSKYQYFKTNSVPKICYFDKSLMPSGTITWFFKQNRELTTLLYFTHFSVHFNAHFTVTTLIPAPTCLVVCSVLQPTCNSFRAALLYVLRLKVTWICFLWSFQCCYSFKMKLGLFFLSVFILFYFFICIESLFFSITI